MKICIICPGKVKEIYYLKAVDEYSKSIKGFAELEIITVPDEQTGREATVSILKEGVRIIQKILPNDYVITLEIDGRMLNSEEFCRLAKSVGKTKRIVFVIGGSLGLSSDVRKRSNLAVSFSNMTFPHQLMRVLLLEQLSKWRHIH